MAFDVNSHRPRLAFWACDQNGVGGEVGVFHSINLAPHLLTRLRVDRHLRSHGRPSSAASAHITVAAADAGGGPCEDSAQQQSRVDRLRDVKKERLRAGGNRSLSQLAARKLG